MKAAVGLLLLLSACSPAVPVSSVPPSTVSTTGFRAVTSSTQPPPVPSGSVLPPGAWPLLRVVDGDTIEVEGPYGETVRVRLIGINTPEHGECFATEAAGFLSETLSGSPVPLWRPDSFPDVDRYGRALRYIGYADSPPPLGETLILGGYAVAYEVQPHPFSDAYAKAQARAEEQQTGMWRTCRALGSTSMSILDVTANPQGPDAEHLNGEFVRLRNTGSVSQDMTGWALADDSSTHRYRFASVRIDPGATVVVHSGCGTDTASDLYWCAPGPVWNNDGDRARLIDASGTVVSELVVKSS